MKLRKPVGPYDKERMKMTAKITLDMIESDNEGASLAFRLFQEGERTIIEGHCAVCDVCKQKYAEIYEHACETKDFIYNYEKEKSSSQ